MLKELNLDLFWPVTGALSGDLFYFVKRIADEKMFISILK